MEKLGKVVTKVMDIWAKLLAIVGSVTLSIFFIAVLAQMFCRYLGIVALLPIVAGNLMEGVRNLAIGGTSVIIVVGVALETVKALEAQRMMRHYKGFLD